MALYCLIVGSLIIGAAIYMLISRVMFVRNAKPVFGVVKAKVTRNLTPESASGKSKHLQIDYLDWDTNQQAYVCDNSFITPLYDIGDKIKLAVSRDKVMVNSLTYIVSAPLVMIFIGCGTLYAYYQLR